jgi:hypothetical protein
MSTIWRSRGGNLLNMFEPFQRQTRRATSVDVLHL